MEAKECIGCKIVTLLVIIGALNWGLMGALNMDLVAKVLGAGSALARIVYVLVGISGIMMILKSFKVCPCQKKTFLYFPKPNLIFKLLKT